MIAIVLVGMFSGSFILLASELNDKYAPAAYDSSQLESYNKLEEIKNLTQDTRDESEEASSNPTFTDAIEDFFVKGFKAFKVVGGSMNIFSGMADSAGEDVDIPGMGLIITAITTIVLIIIIIGIIISTIIKRDL